MDEFLVCLEDGSAVKAKTAQEAAAIATSDKRIPYVLVGSEQQKEVFAKALDAIVSERIQMGIGF